MMVAVAVAVAAVIMVARVVNLFMIGTQTLVIKLHALQVEKIIYHRAATVFSTQAKAAG
jgi:hypothetical protein